MHTLFRALILNSILVFLTLFSFSSGVSADVFTMENRALVVCDSLGEMQRMQKIAEATGELPRMKSCWKISPPSEVIVLDEIGEFVSLTYKNRIKSSWSGSPAYTPKTWLRGFSKY